MKKVDGVDFMEKLRKEEPMWMVLPPQVAQQLPVGLIKDLLQAGCIAEVEGEDKANFHKVFSPPMAPQPTE